MRRTTTMSETKRAESQGVWGTIAQTEPRNQLAQALVQELESGLKVLQTLPAAVTFFGGARIKPDDPFYAAAEKMGELLAETGVPPRTGAGPGIMTAVPMGFRRRVQQLAGNPSPVEMEPVDDGARNQALTQGFNIKLPFEQAVNPAIDVSLELVHFPTRKLMLWENALGVVFFPGGFGTLDELFETWRLKLAGRLNDPFVLYGSAFWQPLIEVLRRVASARECITIPHEAFDLLHLSDDPREAISYLQTHGKGHAFEEPPEVLGRRIAHELIEGLDFLERLAPAVTVIGGSRLDEDDPTVKGAVEIGRLLAKEGLPTRAGGPGPLSVALAVGGHRGSAYLPQQAFGMRREDARNLYGADRVHLVNDRLTHKVLLTENACAFIALPGGLGTLDELFSVLCQLQTRKLPMRPLVLFGSDFWGPIWEVLRRELLEGERRTISPGDLELATITDDPEEAVRLCLAQPKC